MKASRMRLPSSVRIGIFCRLGSFDDSRPVVVEEPVEAVARRHGGGRTGSPRRVQPDDVHPPHERAVARIGRVGEERLPKDIQVSRIGVPRTALKGTSLLVDAVITQTGYAGETVSLDVEDEGRIVGSQEVRLPANGEPAAVRLGG